MFILTFGLARVHDVVKVTVHRGQWLLCRLRLGCIGRCLHHPLKKMLITLILLCCIRTSAWYPKKVYCSYYSLTILCNNATYLFVCASTCVRAPACMCWWLYVHVGVTLFHEYVV